MIFRAEEYSLIEDCVSLPIGITPLVVLLYGLILTCQKMNCVISL